MSKSIVNNVTPSPSSRHLLPRGESLIASLGLGAMAILLATLGGAAWWSVQEHRAQLESARCQEVRATCELIKQSAQAQLAAGDLAGLKQLVQNVKRDHRLNSCRILLPDGRVLLDSDAGRPQMTELPTPWPKAPLRTRPEVSSDDEMVLSHALLAPGRGPAMLVVKADVDVQSQRVIDLLANVGTMGTAGLLILMVFYHRLRRRLLGLGMIREALLAFSRGERSVQVLSVASHLGVEAAAWNNMLQEIERARQEELARSVADKLDRRREARSEMELACDSLAVGLAILDAGGAIRQANGAAASLLRVKRDEIIGKPAIELLPGDEAKSAVKAVVGSPSPQRRSLEITRHEHGLSSVLRVSVRPLRKEDNGSALVMIEDITQQRIAEASRNSFITQATHELRTPLTNMRLCLEMALGDGFDDREAQVKCFNTLNQEARRLERIITEMLSVAEIEAGAMKLHTDDVRLDSLFDEMRGDFEPLAKDKNIELRFDLPPKFPVIQADRDKLVLAIHNLVGNAIKYTPENGRVTVCLRVEENRVAIEVADTGIGIRDEERELVFEKFYRAKDARVSKITGSGLGLALSREVARFHGGDVTLQSEFNRGSTFTLTVPVMNKAA